MINLKKECDQKIELYKKSYEEKIDNLLREKDNLSIKFDDWMASFEKIKQKYKELKKDHQTLLQKLNKVKSDLDKETEARQQLEKKGVDYDNISNENSMVFFN